MTENCDTYKSWQWQLRLSLFLDGYSSLKSSGWCNLSLWTTSAKKFNVNLSEVLKNCTQDITLDGCARSHELLDPDPFELNQLKQN